MWKTRGCQNKLFSLSKKRDERWRSFPVRHARYRTSREFHITPKQGQRKRQVLQNRYPAVTKYLSLDSHPVHNISNISTSQSGGLSKFNKKDWENWLKFVKRFYQENTVGTAKIIPCKGEKCPVVESLLYKKDQDNRPYLDIMLFDRSFSALVDTGSNISLVSSFVLDFVKSLSVPFVSGNDLRVTTADGHVQNVLGYLETYVTVDNISRILKLYLIPSVKHPLILGMDFLKTFNIKIDFSKFALNVPSLSLSVINTIQDTSHLSVGQTRELDSVVEKFKTISPTDRLGRTHLLKHVIDTGDAPPFKQRQYPLPQALQDHLEKEVDNMLKMGIIQESKSSYCSPIWLVQKSDKSYRVCFDGRKLNNITKNKDAYALPHIEVILSQLRDARFISSIDLRQAFHQIPLDEQSRPKTAFSVRGKGLFEYVTTPFGLVSAPATMCRLMDLVIGPSLEPYCFYYLDDIIICTSTFEKHLEILEKIFERLRDANLTVNLDKCQFCRSSLKFLGYVVDQQGLRTDPEKVSAIVNYPVPTTSTQIRRFLGMVSYYRRFLKNFSTLSSSISDLLRERKKNQPITWTPEANEAFANIKTSLTTAPVLSSPDFSKPFFLMCDASDVGIGSVLYQLEDGLEHPVAYMSKKLSKSQRKFSTTERELLAVLLGIDHFRYYLVGRHFTVITDHSSLVWLNNMKKPSPRLARWILQLSQYDFSIIHRKATGTVVADALSRIPEVDVLDLSLLKPDKWYKNLLSRIQTDPEKFPNFKVENNIIYKHVYNKFALLDNNISDWKIVVPTDNRGEILSQYHDHPTAAHFGVYKTLQRISTLYYWPNMRNSVHRYVKRCQVCASCKPSNLPQAGLMGQYRNIDFPFQLISCDLLGPYPRSRKGNQFVLVVVDWFSKFTLVHPLSQATAPAIVKFLENNVFLIFGVPQIVSVDNGRQFISKMFKDLMKKYSVQKIWYNANFHPQINHTERVNKSIVTAIRSYCHEDHKSWDEALPQIAQAIRLSQHEVTESPPSFLVFGRNVPVSGDFYGKIADNATNQVSIANKVHRSRDIQEMPAIFDDVRKRLKTAYARSQTRYNLRKRDVRFHVGDYVWKRNYSKSDKSNFLSAKFMPKFIPCIVHRVVSPLVYELKDRSGKNIGRWHVKDLKEGIVSTDDESDSDSVSDNE